MPWITKLNEDKVREIRAKYASGHYSQRQLAAEYGITQCNIGRVVRREHWRHVKDAPEEPKTTN